MKKLVSILLVLMLLGTQLVFAEEKLGCATPAYVPTFEELTGLTREDIDHIVIRSGLDGIGYSTTNDKVISDIYNTINTKSFNVYVNDGDGWSYEISFIDKNNLTFTYTISGGIKSKSGVPYRTSNEEELKKVVENAYNLIADSAGDKTFTFAELTNLSVENIEKISIGCSKSGLGLSEFSISSPLIISDIFNTFKDMQFVEDTRDGSAGGWLYGINFYMDDGTYIQFGTRIHIDKADYNVVDFNTALEKMAYYYNLIKNIDSSEWATDYILECQELGFLEDVTDLSYKEPVTREKFCEVIYNMLDKTMDITWAKVSPRPFRDTTNEKIFSLCLADIVDGKGGYTFAPNDYLTREEAATIIIRIINKFMPMPVTEMYFEYDDISEVSQWASDSVQIISNLGIMEGVGENKFAPKETYTAEQAIATIMRLYTKK